ncbi:MAG: hypothetical protein WDZ69_02285 [Candidatus Pacearchaeota archaeon]
MDYDKCSVCGVSGSEVRLLDAVSFKEKGVVKVCDSCARKEGIPVLRRPTTFQLKESEKEHRIYRRPASKESGSGKSGSYWEKDRKDKELKDIVEKNYEGRISQSSGKSPKEEPRKDLVDNFHWVIMRARRAKKMTPEQLAKEISESVSAIKMAERGVLPEDDYRIIGKIESFLGIKIVKDEARGKMPGVGEAGKEKRAARVIKFDPEMMKNLTIDDLKRMKEAKEGKKKSGKVAEDEEDLDKDSEEDFKEVFGESESEEESEK